MDDGGMTTRDVFIIDGARTPFLKARGKPGPFTPADLAVMAARGLLLRQPLEPKDFDEVILGCVMPRPEEANIARVVANRLGFDKKCPAFTVQRNCASGMQSIASGADSIRAGRSNLVLVGGTEAMSHAPLIANDRFADWFADLARAKSIGQKIRALMKIRPSMLKPVISLLQGLTDHQVGLSMGKTAEIISARFGIGRKEMDSFSVRSHTRAGMFEKDGTDRHEIVPIVARDGRSFDCDDGVRTDTTIEKLAKLKPVFERAYGSVTAGNSAQITDGSAILILASKEAVDKFGLEPMGRLHDVTWAGVDPAQMGLGPVASTAKLYSATGKTSADIDFFEINEAFAGQVLAVQKAMADPVYAKDELSMDKPVGAVPRDRVNVDGGAIAIGHPVGASGARIVLHLMNVLARKSGRFGVATLCIGGGQGGSALIESMKG